ncbi:MULTISPECIES: hypothetical protein [Pseudomonas]|uniref:hypothetical protein n=1 Tax=Pseudomonas TaxID=286 RepID=UPI0011A4AD67|nr:MULTISPECIES: hypothetical protein [Pseudomonas]MBI6924751.1 hypothetical protein [Pseudomonas putida]NKZ98872.1 hypothetical protein [Prescottella equi]
MSTLKDFVAYNQTAGGQQSFRVHGVVTVPSPAFEPVLVEPAIRHRGNWEALELKLVDTGVIANAVLTEKTVEYLREGHSAFKVLEITHADGGLRIDIEDILALE